MALDYERKKEKESDIKSSISEVLLSKGVALNDSHELASTICNNAIYISPPEKEEHIMELIVLHPSGRGGGRSRKLGNVKLNINKLVEALANGSFAIVGSLQAPILVPMAFIVLWSSLRKVTDITLTENDAAVLWAMWVYRDREKNIIPVNGLLDIVNNHLSKYDKTTITQKDLDFALNNLVKIKSIKKSKSTIGNWWLCEYINAKYK